MSHVSFSQMPQAVAHAVLAAGHGIASATHALLDRVGDSVTRSLADGEREREEAYLAQSVDCYDLERRIHELEHARHQNNTVFWTS